MRRERELLYFDRHGLLPYPGEAIEKFETRASVLMMLHVDPKFIIALEKKILESEQTPFDASWTTNFTSQHAHFIKFQKELRLFRHLVDTDLTWLPVFGFHYNKIVKTQSIVAAYTGLATLPKPFPYRNFHVPYFGINTEWLSRHDNNLGGYHEAFHAIRYTFDSSADRRTLSEKFSHFAGEQMLQIGNRDCCCESKTVQEQYQIFVTILKYFFGKNAYYVLARLSYGEMCQLFIHHRGSTHSPVEWLKSRAKTSLRHKIICLKLGI